MLELCQTIVRSFPPGIRFGCAYGSAVFHQKGHDDPQGNMVDLIFAVDDPVQWHRENIQRHPRHYSFLRFLGARQVSRIQENFGAKVYFNSLVRWNDRRIKYGVISYKHFISDLLDWNTLYISGRLHKPVLILTDVSPETRMALNTNCESALHSSLLMLPETFHESQLFHKIASLSYLGDFRMTIGEDRNKVLNIVEPNQKSFHHVYSPFLEKERHLRWNTSTGMIEQELSGSTFYHHLNLLPKGILEQFVVGHGKGRRILDVEEVCRSMSRDPQLASDAVQKAIRRTVTFYSWTQSVKSIFTAGVSKSMWYSAKKLRKMFKGFGLGK